MPKNSNPIRLCTVTTITSKATNNSSVKKISSYTGYVKQLFIHKDEGGSKDPPESLVLQSVQEKLREK